MSSNLVKYQPYTEEDATQEAEDLNRQSADFLTLKEGRKVVRVLPALAGQGYGPNKSSPFRLVWTHFLRTPGTSDAVSTACPNRELNQRCPICELANKLKARGNKLDQDRAYELFPKRRVYMCVVDREEPDKGVRVLPVGKTIHEALTKIRKDADAGGDFTDPVNGFDIIIERKGSGKNDTEYTVMPARKQSPLGNMEWIEQQPDLNAFAKVKAEAIEKWLEDNGISSSAPAQEKEVQGTATRRRNAADDLDDVPV